MFSVNVCVCVFCAGVVCVFCECVCVCFLCRCGCVFSVNVCMCVYCMHKWLDVKGNVWGGLVFINQFNLKDNHTDYI